MAAPFAIISRRPTRISTLGAAANAAEKERVTLRAAGITRGFLLPAACLAGCLAAA